MKKILCFAIIASFMSSAPIVLADVVIVDSYVILNAVSAGATNAGLKYYDVKRDSGSVNPDFNNSNLGTFNILSTPVTVGGITYAGDSLLQLKGAEIKTTASGGDYQNASNFGRMFYAITPSNINPTVFTRFDLGFRGEAPSYPNYKWDTTGASVNLFSFVSTPGTYRLTVYFDSNGSWWNGTQNFFGITDNNGGSNYSATFSVIPEPSSSLLMGLGLASLVALRLRRHRA